MATGQVRTTPAQLKDPKTRSWFTLNWQIRLVAIGLGLLAAFLDMEWKTVDKYFPKLNKVLHAGFPTTDGDVDYLIGHLQKDLQTLGDPCTDDMTFEQCRARIIANKSVLEDFCEAEVSVRVQIGTAQELKDLGFDILLCRWAATASRVES